MMQTREPTWLSLLLIAMFILCGVGLFSSPSSKEFAPPTESEQAAALAKQPVADSTKTRETEVVIKIRYGDTFSRVLAQNGFSTKEVGDILMALKKVYDPSNIRAGKEISITQRQGKLTRMEISPKAGYRVGVVRDENDIIRAWSEKAQEVASIQRVESEFSASLMDTGLALGVPMSVLAEVVSALSYDVDFQRDIQKGNRFDFMFEVVRDKQNDDFIRARLLRASLDYRSNTALIYRYGEEKVPFYYGNGSSVVKSLLRTPVEGTRISSRFGKRKDPILGYNRMHRGVDFAAPTGTPVYAAGDGKVEAGGWYGNYGIYVRIHHSKTYQTAYAHLKKLAKGIKKGARVKQGQVIGYVGSTGRSTGPHLHFEVHKHNKKVDPLKLALPSGKKLKDEELKQFYTHKSQIESQYAVALKSPAPNITIATTAQGGN